MRIYEQSESMMKLGAPTVLHCGGCIVLLASLLSGCGGGGAAAGGGGGSGGGGGTPPSISGLSPTAVVLGELQGQITVFGQGFTPESKVLIDGQPSTATTVVDSGTLQAQLDSSPQQYRCHASDFSGEWHCGFELLAVHGVCAEARAVRHAGNSGVLGCRLSVLFSQHRRRRCKW